MAGGMCIPTAGSQFENRPTSTLPSAEKVSFGLLQAPRTKEGPQQQGGGRRTYASGHTLVFLLRVQRSPGCHHIPPVDSQHQVARASLRGIEARAQFALFAGHQRNIVVVPENR